MSHPLPTHPITLLFNGFLAALPDRFARLGPGIVWTPSATAIALLLLVLRSAGTGSQSILRQVSASRPDLYAREPSDSSFCRARTKLTQQMLDKAWTGLAACFLELFGDVVPKVWGHRLLALDGTWANGPRARALWRHCRRHRRGRPPKDPKGQPQVLIVALVDVLTRVPVAWCEVEPGRGERSAVAVLCRHLGPDTILLADRGFPSREILDELLQSGCRFIMRMTTGASAFAEVTQACRSPRRDRNVSFQIGTGSRRRSWIGRLVRGRPAGRTSGEMWCLLTNLPRNQRWTRTCLIALYHQRWGIETFFREFKGFLGAGHFHAHTIKGLRQEITMAMVAATLVSAMELLSFVINCHRMPQWNDLRQQRCSKPLLVQTLESFLLMDPTVRDVAQWLDRALRLSRLRARKRRPGRNYPRICKSFYGKWKHRFKRRA